MLSPRLAAITVPSGLSSGNQPGGVVETHRGRPEPSNRRQNQGGVPLIAGAVIASTRSPRVLTVTLSTLSEIRTEGSRQAGCVRAQKDSTPEATGSCGLVG